MGNLPLLVLLAMEVEKAKAHLLAPKEIGMSRAFTEVTSNLFKNSLFRGYDVPKTHEAVKKQWDGQFEDFRKRQSLDEGFES